MVLAISCSLRKPLFAFRVSEADAALLPAAHARNVPVESINEANDYTCALRVIGSSEVVFFKTINSVKIEDIRLDHFEIEVGEMNYGFPIDGILGFDFIQLAGIVIDTKKMKIHKD
jgi:hypothetical protein